MNVSPGEPRVFATTHWSVVLAASQPGTPGHQAALEQLCSTYWYPIYGFTRRRGMAPSDAEDCTQEFFARLLAKEWLAGVERSGSPFRAFLLTAVSRFLANEWDRRTAAKRGGGMTPLSLHDAESRFQAEDFGSEPAERAYDRNWAVTVMDTSLDRLRGEAQGNGNTRLFEQLSPLLSREPVPGEYEVLGSHLGMSPGAVGVAVHRMRRRYREIVRSVIEQTVAHPDETESELRYLVEVLRGS